MKKAKVKIALVIDKNGHWAVAGWNTPGTKISDPRQENEFINLATESLASPDFQKAYWIEAEAEVPEDSNNIPTIQGEVKRV